MPGDPAMMERDWKPTPRYPMRPSSGARLFKAFLIAFATVILFRQIGILPIDINAIIAGARSCG
jgi:hypothetical protein